MIEEKQRQLTGPELRGRMGKAGLSIEQLAALTNRPPRTISRWRAGSRRCCHDAERELRRVLREYGG